MYELSIKKMREAAGFKKQPDAARALGWKERRYASIERGEVKLTAEDACVIAEVFGCTPNDLCGWPPGLNEGFADELDPEEGELLYCYRQSTEERRSKILETARDQAELSQNQAAAPEIEGLEADQVRSA